jgi:biotin carboxylase
MGLDVLLGSRGEHSLTTEVSQGLHLDLDNPAAALRKILATASDRPFAGVLGSDDSTVEIAALAAQQLGLPHNPPAAARLSRRKDLARSHLSRAGCPVPFHRLVDLREPLAPQMHDLPWPCVVKPLNLSASRGVIRADTPSAFIAACERVGRIIATAVDEIERTHVLVEAYIDGIEVAYEGYLHRGALSTLALFDKPDPLVGPFFEETIYVTPSRLDDATRARVERRVAGACAAYGLTTGPVHAELRIDARDAWILEVAARTIGGDCARTLDSDGDLHLEALTIALAIDRPVAPRAIQGARGVMMVPIKEGGILRRVEGVNAASRVAHIEKVDIIAREGHELVPLPEGNQYPGYLFARADTPEQVIRALRDAHAELNFVVAPVFPVTAADPANTATVR